MSTLYRAAAHLVEQQRLAPNDADPAAMRLLAALGYLDASGEALGESTARELAALLRAADILPRLFLLHARQAPGLVFMGGAAAPETLGPDFAGLPVGSLAGSGPTLREAFESCVGEGIEYLSQFEHPGDLVATEPGVPQITAFPGAVPAWPREGDGGGWVRARRLSDGAPAMLPADRCLRRRQPADGAVPPFALSTGCGAGVSLDAAALHGLLELIERDATSLWWRGGRRGRPLLPHGDALHAAEKFLAQLRAGQHERKSWLLDITTDLGVPCAAAMSCGPDGRGFACGTAARMTMRAATRAALKEMCHIELAYDVIAAKRREGGDASLNATDRRHLRRAAEIAADGCALLHPTGDPLPRAFSEAEAESATLSTLVEHLHGMAIETYLVDLTRPRFGVPVARVVTPDLQLDPCVLVGLRLQAAIAQTGGGECYFQDMPLM